MDSGRVIVCEVSEAFNFFSLHIVTPPNAVFQRGGGIARGRNPTAFCGYHTIRMGTDQEGKAEATEGKQYPSHPGGLGVGQDGRSVSASKKESGRTGPGDFKEAVLSSGHTSGTKEPSPCPRSYSSWGAMSCP